MNQEINENNFDWRQDLSHPLLVNTKFCIILCGAPGSGKSTYAEYLLKTLPDLCLISPDLIRAEFGDVTDQSKNGLIFNTFVPARMVGAKVSGQNILIDATSVSRDRRASLIAQAKKLEYSVEIHVMDTPIEVCKARNAQRKRRVHEHVIDRMFAQFQKPTLHEGFNKIVYVKTDWNKNLGNEIPLHPQV